MLARLEPGQHLGNRVGALKKGNLGAVGNYGVVVERSVTSIDPAASSPIIDRAVMRRGGVVVVLEAGIAHAALQRRDDHGGGPDAVRRFRGQQNPGAAAPHHLQIHGLGGRSAGGEVQSQLIILGARDGDHAGIAAAEGHGATLAAVEVGRDF